MWEPEPETIRMTKKWEKTGSEENSAVKRLVMLPSGVFDINGVDIKVGDTVEVVIKIKYQKPVINRRKVIYYKGAFRFEHERENCQSCIGDLSHNCTLEIV